MIQLFRTRSAAAVPAAFRGDKRIARELENLAKWRRATLADPKAAKLAGSLWKAAKKQLKLETDAAGGGKCAFCESRTVRFHCDVEHFRPKATYWWLALCWENYTFSCQMCNQVYKSDRFDIRGTVFPEPAVTVGSSDADLAALAGTFAPDPLDPEAGPTLASYLESCGAEKAGMIHPYDEDPESYLDWEADEAGKHVKPVPKAGIRGHKKWVAQNTISTLGLDADDLSTERWRIYTLFVGFCAIVKSTAPDSTAHQTATAQVAAMTAADASYAGMCRFYRRSFGL
ncbi:MAG: hypothetical protein V4726_01715 [Verrucomicrobiota bacterium]